MERYDEEWNQLATKIPKELHRRLKLHCSVKADMSVQDFVARALREKLDREGLPLERPAVLGRKLSECLPGEPAWFHVAVLPAADGREGDAEGVRQLLLGEADAQPEGADDVAGVRRGLHNGQAVRSPHAGPAGLSAARAEHLRGRHQDRLTRPRRHAALPPGSVRRRVEHPLARAAFRFYQTAMRVRCPHCGSEDVHPRSPMRRWERVAGFLFWWRPFVCWKCMRRFRAFVPPFSRSHHADLSQGRTRP